MAIPALRRCVPWLVAALVVLGVAVRLRQYFACLSYWYDEAYLLVNVWNVSFADLVGPLRSQLVIPPLFLWLSRAVYLVLGPAEWAMRLPAIVCGVAAVFAMVPLARRVVEGPAAWAVVVLCAVCHHGMVHACEVRPYSSDLLATELILLTTAGVLLNGGWSSRVGLLLLAAFTPWLSFPSVFVMAAASLALFLAACRRGSRIDWAFWVAVNALVGLSAVALWWFQARHMYYPGLKEHWVGWGGFAADSSPPTLCIWSVRCLVGIGHYAATGLGVPLMLLTAVGVVGLWRRSRSLAVLVAGPVLIGYTAALLRFYPMADRTVFFVLPCVWLLAGAGLVTLAKLWQGRLVWASVLLLGVLVVPQAVRCVKYLGDGEPKCDFRAALAHMECQRTDADVCWVSHPEAYEVYCGTTRPCLSAHTPVPKVVSECRGKRLWVVSPPFDAWKGTELADLPRRLHEIGLTPTAREQFVGLDVTLYEPTPGRARGTMTPAPQRPAPKVPRP